MKFNAKTRSVQGSSASRRLRRAGRVPAIVYGGQGEPVSIDLDHNEIYHALRKEGFASSVLTMVLDGKEQNVVLRAVQWHAYKPLVLHVDFQRVRADEAIVTTVPLVFVNADNSPAVKLGGAKINHVATEVEISCLPKDLPQNIVVDLSTLEANEVVHLGKVQAPAGVTFVSPEDTVLASAQVLASAKAEGEEAQESATE